MVETLSPKIKIQYLGSEVESQEKGILKSIMDKLKVNSLSKDYDPIKQLCQKFMLLSLSLPKADNLNDDGMFEYMFFPSFPDGYRNKIFSTKEKALIVSLKIILL